MTASLDAIINERIAALDARDPCAVTSDRSPCGQGRPKDPGYAQTQRVTAGVLTALGLQLRGGAHRSSNPVRQRQFEFKDVRHGSRHSTSLPRWRQFPANVTPVDCMNVGEARSVDRSSGLRSDGDVDHGALQVRIEAYRRTDNHNHLLHQLLHAWNVLPVFALQQAMQLAFPLHSFASFPFLKVVGKDCLMLTFGAKTSRSAALVGMTIDNVQAEKNERTQHLASYSFFH